MDSPGLAAPSMTPGMDLLDCIRFQMVGQKVVMMEDVESHGLRLPSRGLDLGRVIGRGGNLCCRALPSLGGLNWNHW